MKSNIQETQSGDLATRLRQRIQAERLADGQFFMTEADLAEEYGVSRTVAREAVGRLVAIGLLEGRKRKGLVVRRPDPLHLLEIGLPSLLDSRRDIAELSMLRYVIEMGAIDLAIHNGTDTQITRLCEVADELEHVIRSGKTEQVVEVDLLFHSVLLGMTGSSLIAGMQRVLVDFFQSAYSERMAEGTFTDVIGERMIWEHQELANAIQDRDSNRARSMMQLQTRSWIISPEPDDSPAQHRIDTPPGQD